MYSITKDDLWIGASVANDDYPVGACVANNDYPIVVCVTNNGMANCCLNTPFELWSKIIPLSETCQGHL